MMHNSLFLRDLLKKMNEHPIVRERRDSHRLVMVDSTSIPSDADITLNGKWQIITELPEPVASALKEDAIDFLARFDIKITLQSNNTIIYRIADDLDSRDCRLSVKENEIIIEGGGIAGIWAGQAWMEFEMRTRRGPFLPKGSITRHAAWGFQISQGPWGANYSVPDFAPEYLDDDSFRLYAHYGINSMMIYGDMMCYVNSNILPELNHPDYKENISMLKDAAKRALSYGVQFSYVVIGPKLRPNHAVFAAHPNVKGTGTAEDGLFFLCSSNEQVLQFYTEFFKNLLNEVPELAGFILIVAEESFYHCKMWRNSVKVPCSRCTPLNTENALKKLLYPIEQSIHSINSNVFLAAWPYTTHQWEHPNRIPFIKEMPQGIDFFLSVEKDQMYQKDGYIKHIWDYSIDFTGPSDNILLTAEACKEVDRPLFVKTETGIGLEVFQFPYVPAMQRLSEKWQNVRGLLPKGVHQSWLFFGMCNSRAEALGLWAAYAPEMSSDEFILKIAIRDFGHEAASVVIKSWEYMSKSMGHLPVLMINDYYIGPSFLGPSHPLIPEKGMKISPIFDGYLFYLQELGETFSHSNIDETRKCLAIDDINPSCGMPTPLPDESRTSMDILRDEYNEAAKYARLAWEMLKTTENLLHTEADRQNYREEVLLTELIYRTILACSNTVKFIMARDNGDILTMQAVAIDEKDNAISAITVYKQAPWLDYTMRIDGYYSAAEDMINEKVKMIDEWLLKVI
jgi:hypothetical protein